MVVVGEPHAAETGSKEVVESWRGSRRAFEVLECRENGTERRKKEVEQTGLKNETREAEGMGLLQWQRKWGGSPD